MNKFQDSDEYRQKKAFFNQLMTIYGRKPVLEVLQDKQIDCYRLHLASSNREDGIIESIKKMAQQRNIETVYHDKQALSRISKNGKQDQGVCLDIHCPTHQQDEQFLTGLNQPMKLRLLALDNITNPQNLGMIIRSACAGGIDGILIPQKGCAALSPLVIKASAGTLFMAPIISCSSLRESLPKFKQSGFSVCALSSHATESLFDHNPQHSIIYVLGNESDGVSEDVFNLSDNKLMIPMYNNVESLNVAVTSALIVFSCHMHMREN